MPINYPDTLRTPSNKDFLTLYIAKSGKDVYFYFTKLIHIQNAHTHNFILSKIFLVAYSSTCHHSFTASCCRYPLLNMSWSNLVCITLNEIFSICYRLCEYCKACLTQTCQARTFCQDAARTRKTSRILRCRQSPRWFWQTNMQMKGSWCSRGHVWDMSPTAFRGVKSLLRQSYAISKIIPSIKTVLDVSGTHRRPC